MLAARFPRPDVRDLVRRMPARAAVALSVESSSQSPVASSSFESVAFDRANVASQSVVLDIATTASLLRERPSLGEAGGSPLREPAVAVAEARGESPPHESLEKGLNCASRGTESRAHVGKAGAEDAKSQRIEPLSADRYGVHFTANGEFCALLDRVRGLAAHRLPSGDLMTLLKRGLEAYERELEKERFAMGARARHSRRATPASGTLCVSNTSQPELSEPELAEPQLTKPQLAGPESNLTAAERPEPEPELTEPGFTKPELTEPESNLTAAEFTEPEPSSPSPDLSSPNSPRLTSRHLNARHPNSRPQNAHQKSSGVRRPSLNGRWATFSRPPLGRSRASVESGTDTIRPKFCARCTSGTGSSAPCFEGWAAL